MRTCCICQLGYEWDPGHPPQPLSMMTSWVNCRLMEKQLYLCEHCKPGFDELDARSLMRMVYDHHSTGCCGHIVFDDFNLEDESIQWCLDNQKKDGHELCRRALQAALDLGSIEERRKILFPHITDWTHYE